jgi:hypothetical protein
MRWAGHVVLMGDKRDEYMVLVWKLKGKRLLGRPRCRWENNVKTYLREMGWCGLDWNHPA